MIKNKWMWTGLLSLACIAAAVAVRPGATKFQTENSNAVSLTGDAKQDVQSIDGAKVSLTKRTKTNPVSFDMLRPVTDANRNLIGSSRVRVTEAQKLAAAAANNADLREPRVPSLDQGSDDCSGVPDLGSILGTAVATGTTVGATNDVDTTGWNNTIPACWQGDAFTSSLAGPDVYYKWTAPAAGNYTFSLCNGSDIGNAYDTGISLWDFTCPAEPVYPGDYICGNDDGGICIDNFGSELQCITLAANQEILIVIDGFGTEAGTYVLDIVACGACDLICDPGAIDENEPLCGPNYDDVTNGGCNSDVPVFTNIACGDAVCAQSGTFIVNDTVQSRDTDWYRLVLTDTTRVTYGAVAEFDLLNFVVFPGPTGFECDSLSLSSAFTAAACETLAVSGCFVPGTYWIFFSPATFTGVDCGSDYNFWVECEPCAIDTGCADASITVDCQNGTTFSSTTIGAGDDCRVSGAGQSDSLSEDVIVEIIIPQDGLYTFSLCGGTLWDSFIHLTSGCCSGTVIESDDDDCGTVGGLSRINCRNLTAGTYYLIVEGWSQTDAGPFTLTVSCCAACDVTCTDSETEEDCSDGFVGSNDGCNLDVPAFEPITCGTTKCGSSGNYQINDSTNGRDIDWYSLTVTDTTQISWTWRAEFIARAWILNSDCEALATLASDTSLPCSTRTISACVRPGTYLLLISTSQFTGTACGSQYTATVNCVDCVIPPSVTECGVDAINSQRAHLATESWGLNGADRNWAATSNLKVFDNFTLQPGEVVGGVSFWGGHVQTANFNNCTSEETMTFEIAFWADSANRTPDFSTGPLCRDTITLASIFNGQVFLPGAQAIQGKFYSYEYPEGQCCSLATGVQHWFSLQATSVSVPDCRFMSLSSPVGSNLTVNPGTGAVNTRSLQYNFVNSTITADTVRNRAFCLNPCALPCFGVTNLSVYNAPGNASAWLNFNAPQAAIYQIYSTTNPNADDNPDNGADANYTLEASTFFPAGPAQWTAPGGFANYKKFVVIANCQ